VRHHSCIFGVPDAMTKDPAPEIKPFEISNHEKQKEKHAAIQFFRSLLD
jgi:hypothetical protein